MITVVHRSSAWTGCSEIFAAPQTWDIYVVVSYGIWENSMEAPTVHRGPAGHDGRWPMAGRRGKRPSCDAIRAICHISQQEYCVVPERERGG